MKKEDIELYKKRLKECVFTQITSADGVSAVALVISTLIQLDSVQPEDGERKTRVRIKR